MAELKRMAAEFGLDFAEMIKAMDIAIADISGSKSNRTH